MCYLVIEYGQNEIRLTVGDLTKGSIESGNKQIKFGLEDSHEKKFQKIVWRCSYKKNVAVWSKDNLGRDLQYKNGREL